MEISENGDVLIIARCDANPPPTAYWKWSHESSETRMTIGQESPYVYKVSHKLQSISSKYCGRTIYTGFRNELGASDVAITVVTVLRK